jgi:hypothetical protein
MKAGNTRFGHNCDEFTLQGFERHWQRCGRVVIEEHRIVGSRAPAEFFAECLEL